MDARRLFGVLNLRINGGAAEAGVFGGFGKCSIQEKERVDQKLGSIG